MLYEVPGQICTWTTRDPTDDSRRALRWYWHLMKAPRWSKIPPVDGQKCAILAPKWPQSVIVVLVCIAVGSQLRRRVRPHHVLIGVVRSCWYLVVSSSILEVACTSGRCHIGRYVTSKSHVGRYVTSKSMLPEVCMSITHLRNLR